MAALTDLSALVNRVTGGNNGNPQHLTTWIDSRVGAAAAQAPVANRWTSLWQYNATLGGSGALPTTATNPARNVAGAFGQNDPTGGRQLWLLGIEGYSSIAANYLIYDRLAQIGGRSGTVITAQTCNISSTRYNTAQTAVGVQIAIEIGVAVGSTATTISASYTNQDGTAGKTTKLTAFGGTGNRELQRILFLPLADGDTGVLSVQSVTVTATTGTAGNFAVLLIKPLIQVGTSYAGGCFIRDAVTNAPALPEVLTGACLSAMFIGPTTTIPQIMMTLHMVEA
jgi:hypothetical protein